MNKVNGFTLIELLVAMAIIAVLMAIGVPAYKTITYNTRVSSEINAMQGDLQFARSEAQKGGQSVTVCASANQTTCAANNVWGAGWIVFIDLDNNGNRDTTTEPLLRKQTALVANDVFTALSGTSAVPYITFNRMGYLQNSSAVTQDIKMSLHPQNELSATWTRCLRISQIGGLKVTKGLCP